MKRIALFLLLACGGMPVENAPCAPVGGSQCVDGELWQCEPSECFPDAGRAYCAPGDPIRRNVWVHELVPCDGGTP